MVPVYYLMIHIIIWLTDWSTYLLPDRQHAISGMIIMNLIFVCYIIRWGGEEFLILMPGCEINQAVRVAEKIRESVENGENEVCKITLSIGVAAYEGGVYHDVIKKADEAMYQAKKGGRKQVVLYEGSREH